jgi:tRNA(Ile2) C34 agmatinyltransferase TiaS
MKYRKKIIEKKIPICPRCGANMRRPIEGRYGEWDALAGPAPFEYKCTKCGYEYRPQDMPHEV